MKHKQNRKTIFPTQKLLKHHVLDFSIKNQYIWMQVVLILGTMKLLDSEWKVLSEEVIVEIK